MIEAQGTSLDRRLDQALTAYLTPAALALAVLYALFSIGHVFTLEPGVQGPMLVLSVGTALWFILAWHLLGTQGIDEGWAHGIVAGFYSIVLVNALAIGLVRQTPEMSLWFALLVLTAGLTFLIWRWFLPMTGAALATWLGVMWISPPDPAWTLTYAWTMLAVVILSVSLFIGRRRSLTQLFAKEDELSKRNRELDEARHRAEQAKARRGEFVARVSHELRTPLSSALGSADLLQEAHLDEEQSELVAIIGRSLVHMSRLIEDILDLSRIDAARLELEEVPVEVEALAKGAQELVRVQAEEGSLELRLHVDDRAPTWVRGDPTRLRQVLVNLLGNAVKFTDDGWVTLRVEPGTGPQHDGVVFEVEDTGPGIPEEEQARIFEPFSQVRGHQRPAAPGSGLGLAITQRLVELMGGTIELESEPGQGTLFRIHLPLEAVDPPAEDGDTTPAAPAGPEARRLNVLVVEDDATARTVVQRQAEALGCQVVTASDGQEALRRAEEKAPDVVLMDVELGSMSGLEVTQRLLERYGQGAGPRVIGLTGHGDPRTADRCREAGMDEVLVKPIDRVQLARALGIEG